MDDRRRLACIAIVALVQLACSETKRPVAPADETAATTTATKAAPAALTLKRVDERMGAATLELAVLPSGTRWITAGPTKLFLWDGPGPIKYYRERAIGDIALSEDGQALIVGLRLVDPRREFAPLLDHPLHGKPLSRFLRKGFELHRGMLSSDLELALIHQRQMRQDNDDEDDDDAPRLEHIELRDPLSGELQVSLAQGKLSGRMMMAGKLVVLEDAKRQVLVFDRSKPEAKTQVVPLPEGLKPFHLAASPDHGKILIGSRRGHAVVLSARDLELVAELKPDPGQRYTAMAVHPSKPWILRATREGTLEVWSVDDNKATELLRMKPVGEGLEAKVTTLHIFPDGRRLLVGRALLGRISTLYAFEGGP